MPKGDQRPFEESPRQGGERQRRAERQQRDAELGR
jgi:hypothetical protein